MKWPWVSRQRYEDAVAQLAGEAYLRRVAEERARRADQEARDVSRRNQHLEGFLDSTDPYTISRKAAEFGNAEAGVLVNALTEKQRLVKAGEPVPQEIEDIIRRGSQTWSA